MPGWPIGVLPQISSIGRYRLADRGYPVGYRHATLALHQHEYHARWRVDDHPHLIEPGDITVSLPDVETRYDLDAPGQCWCVHLVAPPLRDDGLRLPLRVRPGEARRDFSDRFARIVGWAARGDADGEAAARAGLYELIAALATHAGDDPRRASRMSALADRAAARLDRSYQREVDVAHLCRELGARQDRLSAAFRRRHGCTMLAYVARRRIEHAHVVLQTSDLPIGVVADLVGFSDRRYFTRIFRRLTGASPQAVQASRRRLRGG